MSQVILSRKPQSLFAFSQQEQNASVEAILQRYVEDRSTFNTSIHHEDEVYAHGLKHLGDKRGAALILYFKYGADIAHTINRIVSWRFGHWRNVSSFLDFAAGYGRSTRYLPQHLLPSKIWISDIYPQAVLFQREQFGVNGFVSTIDPNDLQCDMKFDVIFVGSLFSHLPERRFAAWLRKLYSLLSDRGIMVFSVHDERILGKSFHMPASGFVYFPDSETKYLRASEYGNTYVSEHYMQCVFQETLGAKWGYLRFKRGFCNFQDLYLLTPNQDDSFSAFDANLGPQGHLDDCHLSNHENIWLRGWAGDASSEAATSVNIYIDGHLIRTLTPSEERRDVVDAVGESSLLLSGWSSNIVINSVHPESAILEIEATSGTAKNFWLHIGSVRDSHT